MLPAKFSLVQAQVDQMFSQHLTTSDAIESHCQNIREFIEACGWNLEDYIRVMMGYRIEGKDENS